MSQSPDWSDSRLLACSRCGATFNITHSTLHFEGCDRKGKGVAGTNMMVKNDAKKLRARPTDYGDLPY
jgi:hypothetical protein